MKGYYCSHQLLFFLFSVICCSLVSQAQVSHQEICERNFRAYPLLQDSFKDQIAKVCGEVTTRDGCVSVQGRPIYYWDFRTQNKNPKKIFALSLIHGDEVDSIKVLHHWMLRLSQLPQARNHWRLLPVANPDGFEHKTRVNYRRIDLNRNFPTKNWENQALDFWKKIGSPSRRYPGERPGSEPEVQCLIELFKEYDPDLVVSIHTPLGVLDFDGPQIHNVPKNLTLPWKSLGHFPGSLGRYLWAERKVPVLTVELDQTPPKTYLEVEVLQDFIGSLVQQIR
ncbi:MAG: M14 family zinc carboxypeptidase [Bdellovibrionaceae bacterium]|nr:M14 family zinc carboxypeptidase [Pseudobdellovibrionaceae bacterium]MDW8190541.1 M14 family zinc carboxypeptidase [Pseudobdellovibrionaceae bacterium]